MKKWLASNNYPNKHKLRFMPDVVAAILKETAFLNELPIEAPFLLRLQCVVDSVHTFPKCECGNDIKSIRSDKFIQPYHITFSQFCSPKCTGKGTTKKRVSTLKEKYGVENVGQLDSVIDKIKQTNHERYGEKNTQKIEKHKATCLEKYGVDSFSQTDAFKSIIQQRNYLEHLSDETIAILNDAKQLKLLYDEHKSLSNLAAYLGCAQSFIGKVFREFQIEYDPHPFVDGQQSHPEKLVQEMLDEIGVDYQINNRTIIAPQEVDFYIPSANLAIEVNGNYWHSSLQKEKKYHQNKTLRLLDQGYSVLTIWEDLLLSNSNLYLHKIKHACGLLPKVYARKCEIRPLKKRDVELWYNRFHVQGFKRSSFYFGLYYQDELVAALSIAKKKSHYEIERYATSQIVVGGFSKLFNHFVNTHHPNSVHTYASLEYGKGGSMYEQSGFKKIGMTPPNFFYVKNGERFTRQTFQRHKLNESDASLTANEIMQSRGYLINYDSGSFKFIWEI